MDEQPFHNPPEKQPVDDGSNYSAAALALGIIGIVGVSIPLIKYFTIVFGILGLVFGVKGRKMSVAATGQASGMATAGMVLGIVGLSLACVNLICYAACSGCISAIREAAKNR